MGYRKRTREKANCFRSYIVVGSNWLNNNIQAPHENKGSSMPIRFNLFVNK